MTALLIITIVLVASLVVLMYKNTKLQSTIVDREAEIDALNGEIEEYSKEHDELIKKITSLEYELSKSKPSVKKTSTKKTSRKTSVNF